MRRPPLQRGLIATYNGPHAGARPHQLARVARPFGLNYVESNRNATYLEPYQQPHCVANII